VLTWVAVMKNKLVSLALVRDLFACHGDGRQPICELHNGALLNISA
jgi:hypothetical protein